MAVIKKVNSYEILATNSKLSSVKPIKGVVLISK